MPAPGSIEFLRARGLARTPAEAVGGASVLWPGAGSGGGRLLAPAGLTNFALDNDRPSVAAATFGALGATGAPGFTFHLPKASTGWDFESLVDWDAGTREAYSLSVAFNQGRWIAEVGDAILWVFATGGRSTADLYGRVVFETAVGTSSGPSSVRVTRIVFDDLGYQPTLVVSPPGTNGGWMVVFVAEPSGASVPLRYAWMPADGGFATEVHATSAETLTLDGTTVTTGRCAYPAGVISEDGEHAFVTYTLSAVNPTVESDADPSRRVRLFVYSRSRSEITADFEVDTDTLDAGYTHSHFPSVAVSALTLGGLAFHVVLVVWRSFLPDPEPDDDRDPGGAIRGRYIVYYQGVNVHDSGPFDIASPTEGGVFGSDPSVIGLSEGQFVVAFQAQPYDESARGSVHTRVCTVTSSGYSLDAFVRVEDSTVTVPHKFPSLATNEARDRVLMAYEVGSSGPGNPHGTRMAVMDVADPTVWTTMGWVDGDLDGVCDPTDVGPPPSRDTVELAGNLGASLQLEHADAPPEQTINPCAVLSSDGRSGYVGFALNTDLGGTDAMSLRLFAVTVPS